MPRLLGAEIDVDPGRNPHRQLQRILETSLLELLCHLVEAGLDLLDQRSVDAGEVPGLRHRTEVAVDVDERAMDEVAPGRDQLVVVAPDEFGPGEIGVLVLRTRDHQVVAQRVGVVAVEHVLHVDHLAPARGELAAFHVQELAGDDVVRQV